MRTALVFGGSGQIGMAVIERLLARDWRVTAVSRTPQQDGARLRWLRGDLQQTADSPENADVIFSLGPLDHFSHWYERHAVTSRRVIAFGSTSVDTKHASGDRGERELAARLRDAEARIFRVAEQANAHATLLRPTLVYGAARDRSLTRIAALARRAGFFALPRDASGLRQPVHVQDLADAALAVIDRPATHGHGYALPGGETLAYSDMVARTLASLRPPARLIRVPAPLFTMALAGAHRLGKMHGISAAAVARMRQDLVFDAAPARQDFGYAPRKFEPTAAMFTVSA